jgi:uroporphyrinogen-III synthase
MTGALKGKFIVNTRAVHQADALNELLRARGAVPLNYPCIAIVSPEDSTPLDKALADLNAGWFDWLVLTSTNTVLAIAKRLSDLGLTLTGTMFRAAAIGAATADAAQRQLGLRQVDFPPLHIAEALAEHLPIEKGTRVLLPESVIARTTLADLLITRGAEVSVVDAYQTICGLGGDDIPRLLAQKQIDALTFTSSSTVTCFLKRLSEAGVQREDALAVYAACIGPKTAATAHECGFSVITPPSEYTLDGLLNMLDEYFSRQITTG